MISQRHWVALSFFHLLILVCPYWDTSQAAGKSAMIKEVLDRPQSYQLLTVTLHGAVTRLRRVDPYVNFRSFTCFNSYTFTLNDETGSIQVFVQGVCGNPAPLAPEVSDGDAVFVEGTVQAIESTQFPRDIIGADQNVRVLAGRVWR